MIARLRIAFAAVMLGAFGLLGASNAAFPPPVVVVYPLTTAGGLKSDVGAQIALLLANRIAQAGGVSVKQGATDVDRAQYLDGALKAGADYYVTGFLTPIGSEISMITQVVSTASGSVVYSTTVVARTYADAAAQADLVRDAIVRHAGRGLAALDAPPPPPSASPAPDAGKGVGVNLTKALRHRDRATPSPSPAASASAAAAAGPAGSRPAVAAAPARASVSGLVGQVAGDADAASRTYAAAGLARALAKSGIASGVLAVAEPDFRAHAGDLCAANAGARAFFASTLVVAHDRTARVQLDVTAYDCKGAQIGTQRAVDSATGRGGLNGALDRAAAAVASGFAKAGVAHAPSNG